MLCADGLNNLLISEKVSIGQDFVSKWRTRFFYSLPRLQEVEQKDPGQPPVHTDEQVIRILEIACRNPKEYGYETSHWGLDQLVDVTIKEETAFRLSSRKIFPFRRYYLQIEFSPSHRVCNRHSTTSADFL